MCESVYRAENASVCAGAAVKILDHRQRKAQQYIRAGSGVDVVNYNRKNGASASAYIR